MYNNFRRKVGRAFQDEKSEVMRERKLKLAELIFQMRRNRQPRFGLFVIFGWKNKWNKRYADIPDMYQDIFARHERNLFHPDSRKKIRSTINFDGAILIDSHGTLLHSGIVIEGLHPRRLASLHSPHNTRSDLSTRLGFKRKVHTRHLSAIAASWELKGTTVFTVSEESGDVHIFEHGRIIFSTVRSE